MSMRRPIYLSVALNVVLLGAWLAAGKHLDANTPLSRAMRTRPTGAAETEPKGTDSGTATSTPASPSLRWEDLASEDLRAYRDNLRRAGCPEPTVRDTMRAVINERFGRRRQELLQPYAARYWEMLAGGEKGFKSVATRLESMKEERGAVLKDILGDEPKDPEADRARRVAGWEASWSWLPESKAAQMVALEAKYQRLRDNLEAEIAGRPDGKQTPEDQAARTKLADQMKTERESLLSAEEHEELRLRESRAGQWAENLRGFEPDDHELRAVARLRLEAEEAAKSLRGGKWEEKDLKAALKQSEEALQAKIKGVLGEERYAQYERAQDGDFGNLNRVAERYGLPLDAAVQAFDARKAALDAAGQIQRNTALSEPERLAALESIQRETERALTQALGREVLATYREHGGEWVAGLVGGGGSNKPR